MPSDSDVSRILIVTAHPDDVDFGAAGSIAHWTERGIDVAYCIVTDGDAGGFDPATPRSEIPAIRRAEQTAAAKTVGVSELHFLAYPDGRVQSTIELRRDITRVIRIVRPDRVVTQSPDRNFARIQASHPDHLAVGEAALCAVYPDARNPFAHPELASEGLEAHVVPEVWLMASPSSDRAVDITDTVDRKISALRCHVSQLPNPDAIEPLIRNWGAAMAASAGLSEGRLAEMFQVIDTA